MADATIDRIVQGAHRIMLLGETMRDPEVVAQMQETPELATKVPKSRSARDNKKEVGV
jgi:hypothetical protein